VRRRALAPIVLWGLLLTTVQTGVLGCGGDAEETSGEAAAVTPAAAETPNLPRRGAGRAAALSVDDSRLASAAADANNWLTHGRTYAEQRFSPLTQIHANNVNRLRLAWVFDTGLRRGHESTPLIIDGVMYVTGSWSVVFALDAATGRLLWKYDPQVSEEVGRKTCCDVVNRGVAVYRGSVFVGALDGRLIALDASSGAVRWETVTVDQSLPYTITGAPRVVEGKVLIGNGGAEFGVRGYVSAYDAGSGELVWRTYTVPGDPSQPFESEALERAAKTWNGEYWKLGGGGTAWDSMAFDPELHLVYVGTGNGSPWRAELRSPGGGDNLYLSSILALDPDTGEIRWHYQTTPADNWDFTATQHMILADLPIEGVLRKVIMQAPKNGFFYVLDRETGELISAEAYVPVTWADGVDPETGRPIPSESGQYEESMALVAPMYLGGHNWHPMSFNPVTGLVYIPAQVMAGPYRRDPIWEARAGEFNTGVDNTVGTLFDREIVSGHLLAWDPIRQKEAWRHPHGLPWNGGTLSTAGNLVFQGTADGRFLALRADDGYLLWQSHSAGTGIIAAPISYRVGGVQYVSVVAGWGGAFAQVAGDAAAAAGVDSKGRVLAWALVDEQITPEVVDAILGSREPELARAADLYHNWCWRCHGANGIAGGVNPDLRSSARALGPAFVPVVMKGLPGKSMPGFGSWLSEDDARRIQRYLAGLAEN
jgi:quinohemoprotein ethanol dehydrogenase